MEVSEPSSCLDVGGVVGHRHGAHRLARLQRDDHLLEPRLLGDRVLVAAACLAHDAVEPPLGLLEVGVDQLGLDRRDVAQRVDAALGVDDAAVRVRAHDVQQRVGLADVGQELVAQALALVGAGHQAGDVVEGDRVPDDLRGLDRVGDLVHALVLDRDDGDVGLDRRERVVGRLGGDARERAEQRGLAGVGHADDPDLHRHRSSLPVTVPSAAPASTSLG